jgi:hypothetical protein
MAELINSLRALDLGLSYDKILKVVPYYQRTKDTIILIDGTFIYNLFNAKTKLFEYVTTDMYNYSHDLLVYLLATYMNQDDDEPPSSKQIKNMEILISYIIRHKDNIYPEYLACKPDNLYKYYRKYPNPKIIDLIIEYITWFDPINWNSEICGKIDVPDYIFNDIVKQINRNDFYQGIHDQLIETFNDELNDPEIIEKIAVIKDSLMKAYDKAAKERAVEVSLGLGYAQMENQEHSTIPSLVLQEIVNQSADLSGMPAWQVYQIVKHINEGTTDKTVRLGVPSNFEDAKE